MNPIEYAEYVVEGLKQYSSNQERQDFLYGLGRYICLDCGYIYDEKLREFERGCQCWNDE